MTLLLFFHLYDALTTLLESKEPLFSHPKVIDISQQQKVSAQQRHLPRPRPSLSLDDGRNKKIAMTSKASSFLSFCKANVDEDFSEWTIKVLLHFYAPVSPTKDDFILSIIWKKATTISRSDTEMQRMCIQICIRHFDTALRHFLCQWRPSFMAFEPFFVSRYLLHF